MSVGWRHTAAVEERCQAARAAWQAARDAARPPHELAHLAARVVRLQALAVAVRLDRA